MYRHLMKKKCASSQLGSRGQEIAPCLLLGRSLSLKPKEGQCPPALAAGSSHSMIMGPGLGDPVSQHKLCSHEAGAGRALSPSSDTAIVEQGLGAPCW